MCDHFFQCWSWNDIVISTFKINVIRLQFVGSCTDSDRIPSTTGALKCVDLSEHRNDSLYWRVNLLQPFEIKNEFVTNYKYHSGRQYFLDFDNSIYNKDSILHNFKATDTIFKADSVQPGNYHVLISSQKYYKPEYVDSMIYDGKKVYATRADDYKFQTFYKSILISNVRISADSISQIDVDFLLELAPN